MLRFSWKMLIADLGRLGWVAILLLIAVSVGSFVWIPSSCLPCVVITLMMFQPRFSQIYFVVPLNERNIKQIFLYRIAIVSSIILITVAIFLLGCYILSIPIEKSGFAMITIEITVFIVCTESSLQSFMDGRKKFRPRYFFAALLVIIGGLSFSFCDEMNVEWIIVTNVSILFFALVYMLCYLRNLTFGDYVYVPVFTDVSEKVERK